jgi:hypothetical protein
MRLERADPPPHRVTPVASSAYGINSGTSERMPAAIAAHNPSDAADITISAPLLLKRNVASGADWSGAASRIRNLRLFTG